MFFGSCLFEAIHDVHRTDRCGATATALSNLRSTKAPLGLADHRTVPIDRNTSAFIISSTGLSHSHAPRRPVVPSDEADKLPHLLHVLAWLTRAVGYIHHDKSHCGPSQSHHLCTAIDPGASSLNFVSPRSKLTTPCDFAWLCCGLMFPLSKLWTRLLRPLELVHSAHCRYAFSRMVFSPKNFGAGTRLWACVSSARA